MELKYPTLGNGRYEVQQCIGIGGMAAVFKCYDTTLMVHRAVKVLRPEYVVRNTIRERFKTEAIAMATLNHPNVVHVYDHGLEGLTLYILMEYLPHGSLQQYIDNHGVLNPKQAASLCIDVAKALEVAHDRGIIHRDIKPDNILLHPNGCKIADFGIARDSFDNRNGTKTQAVMGTLPYMSPEQRISAKKVGPQSDIYALIASFFVLLTLEDPTDIHETEERIRLIEDLPENAQNIIHKGCSTDLTERYKSVRDVIADLECLREDTSIEPSVLTLADHAEEHRANLKDLLTLWKEYTGDPDEIINTTSTENIVHKGTNTFYFSEETWDDNPQTNHVNPEPQNTVPSEVEAKVVVTSSSNSLLWFGLLILFIFAIVSMQVHNANKKTATLLPSETEENIVLLGHINNPADDFSQKQFTEARTLFLKGNLNESSQILTPLLTKHPNDPALHLLITAIEILQGHSDLPLVYFDGSPLQHPQASQEYKTLLDLLNRTRMIKVDFLNIEKEWLALRDTSSDPLVEVYHLLAMRFVSNQDFQTRTKEYAANNPDSVLGSLFNILAFNLYKNPTDTLHLTQQAHSRFPTSTTISILNGQQFMLTGKLEVAQETFKQILIETPTEYTASYFNLILSDKIKDDSLSQQSFLMGMADYVPPLAQILHVKRRAQILFNRGDLAEAIKLWDFCINLASEQHSKTAPEYRYLNLQCSAEKIHAIISLQPTEVQNIWEPLIGEFQTLLNESSLHPTDNSHFTRDLLYFQGRKSVVLNNLTLANNIIQQLQKQPTIISDTSPPLVQILQHHLLLAQNDVAVLEAVYNRKQQDFALQKPTVQESFFQFELATQIERDDADKHLRQIIEHKDPEHGWHSSVVKAKAILYALELNISTTYTREELVQQFKEEWNGLSTSHKNETLILYKRFERIVTQ